MHKTIQVQGVHHITIVGSTRQSAIDFWQGTLGMPFIFEQPNLGKPDENHLYLDPGDGRLLTVFTNESRSDARRPAPREVGCVEHLAMNVSRATFTLAPARLRDRGIDFIQRDRGFMDSIYLQDPNGLKVELACYKFETPEGFRAADVLMQAHKLRVERGDHHITDEHVADAIELLLATRDRLAVEVAERTLIRDQESGIGDRITDVSGCAGIPILIHFQEVDHFPNEGAWGTGFAKTFESILKTYPRTTFIGHADAFWANVSADYHNEAAYPTGPIARGGLTDKWLGDYPNLFGDLSANSGNNAMSRDPSFTADFLKRHQDKLLFGSDCACSDGHGGGVSQGNNPAAARMAGKCVARETLSLLKRSTSPDVFRKIVWENAHGLLRIPA